MTIFIGEKIIVRIGFIAMRKNGFHVGNRDEISKGRAVNAVAIGARYFGIGGALALAVVCIN